MLMGQNWRQVVACLIMQAVSGGAISSSFSVLAMPLGTEFEANRMTVMFAMTVMLLVTAVLSPIAGSLMERVSMKALMSGGSAALVLGFTGLSFTTDLTQVITVYAVLMAPANVLIGPLSASVLLARWFDKARGKAMGIAAIGISLGGFAFPPIVQLLIEGFGWRTAMQVLAVAILVLTATATMLVIDRPAAGQTDAPRPYDRNEILSTSAVLHRPDFWLLAAVFGVLLTGMIGLVTNMVPVARDHGVEATRATLLIAVLSLGSLAGKLVFAAFADRVQPRAILQMGVVGFFVGMLCFWGGAFGFAVMALGAALIGLANGGAIPLQAVVAARVFGVANIGRAVGLLNLVIMLMALLVPPMFGFVHDRTGTYAAAFLIYLTLAVVALVLTFRMGGAACAVPRPA